MFFIAAACSCSGDDAPASLTGTWKLTEIKLQEGMDRDANQDGVAHANFLHEIACYNSSTVIFNEGSDAVFHTPNEVCEPQTEYTAYTVSGNTVTVSYVPEAYPDIVLQSGFKRSGNKLTVTVSQIGQSYIPGGGSYYDSAYPFQYATFVYTKQ